MRGECSLLWTLWLIGDTQPACESDEGWGETRDTWREAGDGGRAPRGSGSNRHLNFILRKDRISVSAQRQPGEGGGRGCVSRAPPRESEISQDPAWPEPGESLEVSLAK